MEGNRNVFFSLGRFPVRRRAAGERYRLRRAGSSLGAAASGLLLLLAPPHSRGKVTVPPAEERFVEDRYINAEVPDIDLACSPGGAVSLSRLWEEKPVILTLVFANCAGTCSPFLHSLKDAAGSTAPPGKGYQVVVLGFDPRDTVRHVAHFAEQLDVAGDSAWRFCASSADGIERLSRSIGFRSRWDDATRQFDHPSLIVAVDRGRTVRLLAGFPVDPRRLREVVGELRQEFLPFYPLSREVLFRCLAYDPERDVFVFDWGSLLLLAPGALSILFTLGIFAWGRITRSS